MDAVAKTSVYFNALRCEDLGIEYVMYSLEEENDVSLNVYVTLPAFVRVMYSLDDKQYEECVPVVVNAINTHRFNILICPIANQPGRFYIF